MCIADGARKKKIGFIFEDIKKKKKEGRNGLLSCATAYFIVF